MGKTILYVDLLLLSYCVHKLIKNRELYYCFKNETSLTPISGPPFAYRSYATGRRKRHVGKNEKRYK